MSFGPNSRTSICREGGAHRPHVLCFYALAADLLHRVNHLAIDQFLNRLYVIPVVAAPPNVLRLAGMTLIRFARSRRSARPVDVRTAASWRQLVTERAESQRFEAYLTAQSALAILCPANSFKIRQLSGIIGMLR